MRRTTVLHGVPDDFAGRLGYALKTVNMSPASLSAAVGVDKSVVSRWLGGRTQPSGHNLSRIGAAIGRHAPAFSARAFEAPSDEFLGALHPGAPLPGGALALPFGVIEDSRHETTRRGMEYFGRYHLDYWSFSRPGLIARMHMMLRPRDGLIEARYGARGFEFRGWALLLLNRLYIQLAEERFEALAFIVTNAGQQPVAELIRGLLMGPSEGLMVPTVSPVVLSRVGDITGDAAEDEAAYEAGKDFDPLGAGAAIPDEVRRLLTEDCTVPPAPAGSPVQLRTPYRGPGE